MDRHFEEAPAASNLGSTPSREWLHQLTTLVESALDQFRDLQPAQSTLLEAASLLRRQIEPPVARRISEENGRLRAWQARKVLDYIDRHLAGPVLVADLCSLVQRSEGHFSNSFKRTFGESPHVFLVRRRVELAARYMLTTEACLSDIALRCGFTDQAHLSNRFRQFTGQTPAAWRRARKMEDGAVLT
jgi:AraC family transcriptional regulator